MVQIGVQAILKILSDFVFIFISLWAIQHLEPFSVKKNMVAQKIFNIFLAIAVGYNVSNFAFNLIQSSQNMIFLFE